MPFGLKNKLLLVFLGVPALALAAACAGSDVNEIGRCSASFVEIDQQARDAVAQAFIERNGSAWEVTEVGEFAGHVVRATRDTGTLGDPMEIDRTAAENLARTTLLDNADLLGLSEAEISALDVMGALYNPEAGPLQWTVELAGYAPIPGYEDIATERRLRVVVDIAKDGLGMGVYNSSDIWPALDICSTPMLAADDPMLLGEVVGTELYFADMLGEQRYAGTVAEESIVAIERVIHHVRREGSAPGESRLTFRLAYRIDVALDLLTWSFFVDPDNGALIEIQQNFVT